MQKMEITAQQLAALINGRIEGDPQAKVCKPARIEDAEPGDFAFLDHAKYESYAYSTRASVLLVHNDFQPTATLSPTLIRVAHVREALAILLNLYQNQSKTPNKISQDARVHERASIGQNVGVGIFTIVSEGVMLGDEVVLHDQVFIGANVKIGARSVIYPGVKVHADTQIGTDCIIKSNAVIGSEGFGFAPMPDGSWKKVPQVGNVIIGNHVEIGANTCIDRGALGPTVIADGAKLDNLIQIAHNVQVGHNTAMAAQVGVAGSTEIGANCQFGGQAGVAGHIKIANGTKVQAQSGIAGNIKEPNTAIFGSPAIHYGDYVKAYLVFKSLPEMEKTPQKGRKSSPINKHTMEKRTDVATLGEFKLIKHLTEGFKTYQPTTSLGIGDDAAIIDLPNEQCMAISTDMLVEGIHFDTSYTPMKHLGYKCIAVNLSDICAMNILPSHVTVSIALSNRYSVEALEELYAGIKACCDAFQVDLIGGDTTSSPKGLVISITAVGLGPKANVVYRNGAKPGDLICITGDLGGAYMGLQLLEREKRIFLENPGVQPDLENQEYIIGRQLKPEPRIDTIEYFIKNGIKPTSMIDISDGLASELFHICSQSGVGALIEESGVPIHPETELQSIKFKLDPISAALSGGEDYELLFTVSPEDVEKVKYMPELYIAGEILDAKDGIRLNTKGGNLHDITAKGWTHF